MAQFAVPGLKRQREHRARRLHTIMERVLDEISFQARSCQGPRSRHRRRV